MSNETPVRFLNREALKSLGVVYSNVHSLRLEAQGRFPKRIYLSPGRIVWLESEIQEFLARRIAERAPPPKVISSEPIRESRRAVERTKPKLVRA
jgi:prophage regulatory protein